MIGRSLSHYDAFGAPRAPASRHRPRMWPAQASPTGLSAREPPQQDTRPPSIISSAGTRRRPRNAILGASCLRYAEALRWLKRLSPGADEMMLIDGHGLMAQSGAFRMTAGAIYLGPIWRFSAHENAMPMIRTLNII